MMQDLSHSEASNDGFKLLPVHLSDGRVVTVQEIKWIRSALDDVEVLKCGCDILSLVSGILDNDIGTYRVSDNESERSQMVLQH
jgi:hypothetical protein